MQRPSQQRHCQQEDGWDVVNKKEQQILNFDNKQFIIEILNTESFRNTFAEATLLILPELWKDFNLSDWFASEIAKSFNWLFDKE